MRQPTKFRFTNRAIEQLPACPADAAAKSIEYTDTEVTGLKLQVGSKTNRKFWFWRYVFQRKKRAIKLGEFPSTDVAEARKRALEMRGLLDQGKDPQAGEDRLKVMPSLKEFAESEYLPHARQTKRSHKDDASRLRIHLLPKFGHKKLSEITMREIQAFVGEIAQSHSPATANRLLSLIARMLKLATLWQIVDRNVCVGIPKFREPKARERFLSTEEISRLYRAMESDSAKVGCAALKLMLLTGQRRNEILTLKWSQVDLEAGVLFLEKTKSGKTRHVVLSQAAIDLLNSQDSKGSSDWVFPGRSGDGPLVNVDKTHKRLTEAAGLEKFRVHDLRHSHASLLANNGVSLFVIQQTLGHSSPTMTMRYSHLCDAALRQAADVAGEVVARAAAGKIQREITAEAV